MDRVRLSSAATPIYKYIFPAALTGMLVLIARSAAVADDSQQTQSVLAVLAINLVAALAFAVRLKAVDMDLEFIYIRGLRREVVARLSDVIEVRERWLLLPGVVKVIFRQPTEFGDRIIFRARGVGLFGPSEATEDLRARTGLL